MNVYIIKYKLLGKSEERAVQGWARKTPYYKTKSAAKCAWTHFAEWHGPDFLTELEYVRIVTLELKETDSEYIMPKKE